MMWRAAGWAALLSVGVLLPWVVYPVLAADILAWALFAAAFDIMLGYTGMLSFGHAAFFGAGAYAAGLLALDSGLPYPLSALAGALVAGLIALPLMSLSIRRKGIYFSMITLAFAQMVFYVINEWRSLTGGENGVQGIPRHSLLGLDLTSSTTFYYAALPVVILGLLLCWRTVRSPFGRVLLATRENEVRTETLGYPVARYKLMAAVLSCTLSGLAGGLYVANHGFVALDSVHWSTSGLVVIMVLLGGMGTRLGPLAGAALVLLLRDFLSSWTDAWGVVTGGIFVAVILVFRQGIVGTLESALISKRSLAAAPPAAVEEGASTSRS